MNTFKSIVIVAVFGLIGFGQTAPANKKNDKQGTEKCASGQAEGTATDIGRYWYECSNGHMIPKGCLTDAKTRVDIGNTFDNENYRMQCVMGDDGFLTIVYVACVQDGRAHNVDEQWHYGNSWYTCQQDGNNVRVHLNGCVTPDKQRVELNEKYSHGDFVYQCLQDQDGNTKSSIVGCVISNGEQIDLGEFFDDDQSTEWFVCTNEGRKAIGCFHHNERLKDGDRYFADDVIYACKVNENGAKMVPYACLQRTSGGVTIERRISCEWVEGKAPYQYQMTCRHYPESNTVVKIQTRCDYKTAEGTYKLAPNCYYQLNEKEAVGCSQDSTTQRLSIEVFLLTADGRPTKPEFKLC